MPNKPEINPQNPLQPAGGSAKARRLVVLVPGFNGHTDLWKPLLERLKTEPGFGSDDAYWLLFDHATKWHSVGRLDQLGRELNALIAAEWIRAEGFDDVVLVGHSMGGLITRHAYLLAGGGVPDEGASDWASRVSRIVLLASVNRGIDASRASWRTRVGAYVTRAVPFFPRLRIADVQRGSYFLTNLRINWIRHFGKFRQTGVGGGFGQEPQSAPLVVQLLGTADGFVSSDDSKDVLAFPEGHYLEVPEANHNEIYRLDLAKDPELRYSVLRRGFTGEFINKPVNALENDPVRRVIFLLHGIRASNVDDWVDGLEQRINDREGPQVVVVNPDYGYLRAARFVLPSVRRKYIRVFQDWYTEELAKHSNAEFDVIAHSNGTYILGHSLLKTPGMRFTNVALAGSVLPQNFWQRFKILDRQVGRIRNDRANRDWPVALLCSALEGFRMRDIGTGGFAGFFGDKTHEVAYHAGGHGEALSSQNLDKLVDFALGGPIVKPANLTTPGYYRQLSNIAPYGLLVLLVIAACFAIPFVFQVDGQLGMRVFLLSLLFLAIYVVLDVI